MVPEEVDEEEALEGESGEGELLGEDAGGWSGGDEAAEEGVHFLLAG